MKRRIIRIDEEKCNGCGACAAACHEGAIQMVNGKARLTREDYCDGLGDCLPACPAGAITFEEREAPAYDGAAAENARRERSGAPAAPGGETIPSELRNWPVQIKLVPVSSPVFQEADLLIAADCTAYACASFHRDYIRGRVVLVGCTKLDGVNYAEKLTEIFRRGDIRSITVLRMEVPCCGGMEYAVRTALEDSGKAIPLQVVTLSTEGKILD